MSRARSDRCAICGSAALRTDEALDGGVVRLGECRRCAHRWTVPPPEVAPAQWPARRSLRHAASPALPSAA